MSTNIQANATREQSSEKDQLYKIRHSAAHVMAEAVLELYPEAKIRSARLSIRASTMTSTWALTLRGGRAHFQPRIWIK